MRISRKTVLANNQKKSWFISMVKENMLAKQNNDADVLFIKTVTEQFSLTNTAIDFDEHVLHSLVYTRTPTEKTIFFLTPVKAQQQKQIYIKKCIYFQKFQSHVLFSYAIAGCDTPSEFYRRGKTTAFKMFKKKQRFLFSSMC